MDSRAIREARLAAHIGLRTLSTVTLTRKGRTEDEARRAWEDRRVLLRAWVDETPKADYP